MKFMERRVRRNSVTRTYPIYAISPVEFIDDDDDDDESIIEIKPIKRQRRPRKYPSRVKPEVSIDPYVIYGKNNQKRRVIFVHHLLYIRFTEIFIRLPSISTCTGIGI